MKRLVESFNLKSIKFGSLVDYVAGASNGPIRVLYVDACQQASTYSTRVLVLARCARFSGNGYLALLARLVPAPAIKACN